MEINPILPVIQLETHEKELRTKSEDVDLATITSDEFKRFLKILYDSMMNVELPTGWMHAGISAVQVNKHINVFYAYNSNSEEYDVFINPKLELLGDSKDIKEESCLSILNQKGNVRRHKRVRVTYFNTSGQQVREKFSGWNARVIQHEFDHLQGVLFIDKLEEDN